VSQSGVVCWFCEAWEWSHAGAVSSQCEHSASRKELHCLGAGIGIAGSQPVHDISDVAMAFGERAIVAIRVATVEQHNISEPQPAVLFLEAFDIGRLHDRADSVGSLIQQTGAVDDAGFAAKLPWFDHVGPGESEGAGLFAFEFRAEYGMGWDIHLCACVSVQQQHIEVKGALGADGAFGDSLKTGEWCGRPRRRIVG